MFAYATGVTSSRELERRCLVDVAFRWPSANEAPDYRSISRFRRRHLAALEDLLVQVLQLCARAGLVRLGRVALDGTKLDANASRHKAMSYDHIVPRIAELEAEVKVLLEEAARVDQAEDEAFGEDRRGDELSPSSPGARAGSRYCAPPRRRSSARPKTRPRRGHEEGPRPPAGARRRWTPLSRRRRHGPRPSPPPSAASPTPRAG